ncbi:PDR/VanB family oxidoreductase [Arthrobacter methylotrophus]|uniref:PDR/VanB family oxidoreductase n=1 Tax=Arthrobacter methylotrophus TaxID=121291 RepID=A0ABV5UJM4_9MICC
MQTETRIPLTVSGRRDESEGVISLLLASPDATPLPAWAPGAHIDVVLDDETVRQYSLCSRPADAGTWRIAVLREPAGRGGSARIHDSLRAGASVTASVPRNKFALHRASRYIFIAGGIGITPILPMIEQAEADGADWSLLYGGRTRGSMAFLEELGRYGDRVTIAPQDEVGLLDLKSLLAVPQTGTLIYACGPEPLLLATEAASAHWPKNSLRVERFAPKVVETVGEDESFEVEFAESGLAAIVPPGTTILEVAEKIGINVFSSCQEGTCGTCETSILAGRAEHRDSLLTDSEKDEQSSMMICVSRAEHGCPKLVLKL